TCRTRPISTMLRTGSSGSVTCCSSSQTFASRSRLACSWLVGVVGCMLVTCPPCSSPRETIRCCCGYQSPLLLPAFRFGVGAGYALHLCQHLGKYAVGTVATGAGSRRGSISRHGYATVG